MLEHLKSLDAQRQETLRLLEEQRQGFQTQILELRQDICVEREREQTPGSEASQSGRTTLYEQRIESLEAELGSIRQKLESSKGSYRSVSGSARESSVLNESDGSVSGEGCIADVPVTNLLSVLAPQKLRATSQIHLLLHPGSHPKTWQGMEGLVQPQPVLVLTTSLSQLAHALDKQGISWKAIGLVGSFWLTSCLSRVGRLITYSVRVVTGLTVSPC